MPEQFRILIIDDSPEDCVTYRRLLKEVSEVKYAVEATECGEDGLELCRERPPDCILLDYNLPDFNGLEFLAEMSADARIAYVSVVMLTGQGNEAIAVEAMKKGAQDYLVKGQFNAGQLHRAITNAVEKVALLRTIEDHRKELERSNRELEQFAYVASHDLQAPLHRAHGFCELLQRRYQGKLDSEADEFIRCIVESTKHMQSLVSSLLNYSRLGTREQPLEPVDCNVVVGEVLEHLGTVIKDTGAQVTRDELPMVQGDPMQMMQLFQNLIANGIKYRHEQRPPHIRISARISNGETQFAIKDNGVGIEPKYTEEVFALFKRLHGSDDSGSGIGLAICRKIVQRLGGHIWVESQLGEGSTFFFSVPLDAE